MTVRNLDHLFKPGSVALIGASKRTDSVGAVLARNLLNAGFEGPVMPVNPKYDTIDGMTCHRDVASLPVTPELAVISTPPDSVPRLIAELGARGTRAAVVITAGFGEGGGTHGAELQQAMLDAARPHLLRIVGPNCLGILVPGLGLNASFAHMNPNPGHIAFVTQSGAVVTSVIDWAAPRDIGFSHLVSLGGMADVDFGDMLDYLASDQETRAILLYVEAITQARKFMSAARAAARMKPVVVVKAGRFAESARAASSHTGALAGVDAVYDAAFRRAGMLRVYTMEDLFDAVETLALGVLPQGDRLAIVTNGGGMGVMATDTLIARGGRLAELGDETMAALESVLPPTWSRGNPVDIIGDAPGSRYHDATAAVLADPGVDAVLALHCPVAVVSASEAAQAVIEANGERRRPPVLASWIGDASQAEPRRLFARAGIPSYQTPGQAVAAFMHMVEYRRGQETLMETPPSVPVDFLPDVAVARAAIEAALADGRDWLSEPEAKEVLAAYGIAAAATLIAADADAAVAHAAAIGGPVVLKILSPDITHKSDVGGVALDLDGPAQVREAAETMLRRVAAARPRARIDGISVQPMIRRRDAFELIVGASLDAQFGMTVLFGQGGTGVEVIGDRALALPPLNMHLAQEVMTRTRIYRLLQGYRDRPAADLAAIALTLVKLSQLIIDLDAIEELDINPLLADADGVIALDARIRVTATPRPERERLAIRPYPQALEEIVELGDGRKLLLRPVMPEDEPMLQQAFAQLTPEEIRMRFFVPLRTLSHVQAARFTQIDYDREMALVLTEPGVPGTTKGYGVVRITADPDNERAEYAIIVLRELTGMGLGLRLMQRIIDYARDRGIGEIYGDVLRENRNMLGLCERLGFTSESVPGEVGLVRVRLNLRDQAPA